MSEQIVKTGQEAPRAEKIQQVSRRKFLSYAGLATATAVTAASCTREQWEILKPKPTEGVDLGSGDIGILNYAYALEQLEAAFYLKVVSSYYQGATDKEKKYLNSICAHEIAHREFLKNALGDKAIPALKVDFSSIDFRSRDSVLSTSKAFEDLGVSAYNGAGELIQSGAYLLIAGKIVSVEARHAAAVRDLIKYGDFAGDDVVDANGLDVSRRPPEVLMIASKYIVTKINASNLPTS